MLMNNINLPLTCQLMTWVARLSLIEQGLLPGKAYASYSTLHCSIVDQARNVPSSSRTDMCLLCSCKHFHE